MLTTRLDFLLIAVVSVVSVAGQTRSTFTGVITDSECASANHSLMRMGDTDPECVKACIDEHGATYLLFDGKSAYQLDDQKAPAAYAGHKVVVTGMLDSGTRKIHVESIQAAT